MRFKMEKESFKAKWSNYWYYYKYHTLFGVFVIIVVILIVFSCMRSDEPVALTVVDTTAMLGRETSQELVEDFAKSVNIDTDSVVYRNSAEFPDDSLTERTGVRGLTASIEYGDLEGVFVVRGREYSEELVGNIEKVLPEELIDELGNDVLAGYLEEKDGVMTETDNIAGIIVNDAKLFKETYGELDVNIVLQIPSNCKNKDNAAAFVKYLFGIE